MVGTPTRFAGEQASQQVVVTGVVTERQHGVGRQLIGGLLVGGLVDDSRHRNGDPFRLGPRSPTGPLAGPGIPSSAISSGRRRCVDLHNQCRCKPNPRARGERPTTTRKSLTASRPPGPLGEPLQDLAYRHAFVDQPAIEHADDRGLVLVDDQVSWYAVAFGNVAIAVGLFAGNPVAGPGLLQLASAEPFAQHGPLVLSDSTLNLQE